MKSEIDKYVIQEVRKRREEMGFSQETLSYKIGRSATFVGNVESGKAKYSVTHLNLLAIALNTKIQNFFPSQGRIES